MLVKALSEGEPFRCAGNEYFMLLPRDISDCCEVVLEKVPPGHSTPPNAHSTFIQVYVMIAGEAEITIGQESRSVNAPAVALIPRNTHHQVTNHGRREVQYLYITVWPEGIPAAEREGGWRKACADMVREYAERGYPPDPETD